jgi:hypothetical protein
MMLDEQDEFLQHIMANRNAAVAAAADLTTHTSTSEGTLVDREVDDTDFVRSAIAATAGLMTKTGTSEGTLVEREVNDSDLVRSSG